MVFSSKNYKHKNLKIVIYPCFLDDIHSTLDNSCMCQNELILILYGTSLDQQVGAPGCPTVPSAVIWKTCGVTNVL
jgi:hypothetical protein